VPPNAAHMQGRTLFPYQESEAEGAYSGTCLCGPISVSHFCELMGEGSGAEKAMMEALSPRAARARRTCRINWRCSSKILCLVRSTICEQSTLQLRYLCMPRATSPRIIRVMRASLLIPWKPTYDPARLFGWKA